ncbi:MAG: porin [Planctomycetaceae bacterium]|nr:porin [Planctomycetaceae bacterium]
MKTLFSPAGVLFLACCAFTCSATLAADPADPIEALRLRLEKLEQDNARLQERVDELNKGPQFLTPEAVKLQETAVLPPSVGEVEKFDELIDRSALQEQQISLQETKLNSLQQTLNSMKSAAAKTTYPSVRVTGFFQADSVWVQQSPDNQLALVNQDTGPPMALGDIQDGADFRRTRLAATGDVWENVSYMIEMDFAFAGRPSFMDVYLDMHDIPLLGNVRVGQWRQPFGMDALTSVKDLMFLERALPFAFVPFRQTGVGFYDSNEELGVTWAASAFRYPVDAYGGNVGDNGGYGGSTRLTGLLVEGDNNEIVHVGFNYAYLDPSNDAVQYRNQPEIFDNQTPGAVGPANTTLPFFVNTGILPTQNINLYGVELAGSYGSLLAQSEFMAARVDRTTGSNLTFWGGYAQVSYVLTGEHHAYNKKSGVYGRVIPDAPFKPGCGYGAWEVAGRWSILDLNDGDITGNELQDLTLGVNWYLNKYTKFQFNWVHAMLQSTPPNSSLADLFAVRAQLDF